MILPNDRQWMRVEELAAELGSLTAHAAAERIKELGQEGEPASILTLVGGWLSLPPSSSPLGIGSVVANRYTLREKLGEGGMGSVWRATQQMIARDVAIKMIHPALVTPALQGRFCAEMEMLGKLEHPGIVKIFDAGITHWQDSAIPFYAMELVEGSSLNHWAAVHRQDRGRLLRLMAQICGAIQHAHDRQIVHRDLKPLNIIVRKNGQPVVLDFGIARLAGAGQDDADESFTGTPQYAAPEQHSGRDRDFRSGESVDVYAAGAILFEILTGRRLYPFRIGTPIAEMRRKILEETPQRLASVLEDCPPLLDEIVARALRRDPADRYYSIVSLERALDRAATLFQAAPTPALPPWAPAEGAIVPRTHWKLIEKLGGGGAGQVWLGTHDQLDERRVFKFCDTEEKARTLKRELTLFRLLKERIGRNPHFVQLHEVSLEEEPWYLMMDCVDARELAVWCKAQPGGLAELNLETRVEIVAQVAEALQAAHESGILHRDIKPANILVRTMETATPSGLQRRPHVLIADFGIGQIVAGEFSHDGTHKGFTVTVSDLPYKSFAGTVLYMAPEVLEGGVATSRSDIYSLGIVFWQLLTGDLHAALDATNWSRHISDPLLLEDLTRCLSSVSADRWPSAGELASSLRSLPQRRAAKARRQEELAKRERAAFRRGAMRTAFAALIVIVVIAGLAWVAWIKSIEAKEQKLAAAAGHARATLSQLQGLTTLRSREARDLLFEKMPSLEAAEPELKRELRSAAITILAQPWFEPIKDSPLVFNDGDFMADLGGKMIRANAQNRLPEVVDLLANPPTHFVLPQAESGMTALHVDSIGRVAGAIAKDGALHLWQSKDFFVEKAVAQPLIEGPVHSGCYAFSGTTLSKTNKTALAVARPDGAIDVSLIDNNNEPPLRLLRRSTRDADAFPESTPATMLAFCSEPEGVLAAAGPGSNLLLFWSLSDIKGKPLEGHFAGCLWHSDTLCCMQWSTKGPEIATGTRDGILRIWRFSASGKEPQTKPLRQANMGEPIRDIAWNSDGTLLAVLLDSGNIRLLRAEAPEMPALFTFAQPGAAHLSFIGSNTLASWSSAKTCIWGEADACFTQRAISRQDALVSYHHNGTLTVNSSNGIRFFEPRALGRLGGFKVASDLPCGWLVDSLIYHDANAWKHSDVKKASNPERLQLVVGSDMEAGRYISSPMGRRLGCSNNGLLNCFDGQTHKEKMPARIGGNARLIAISDAEPLSAWVEQDTLKLHHHGSGVQRSYSISAVLGLAFSPRPGLLACRTEKGIVFADTTSDQTAFSPVLAPGAGLTPVAFSVDGRWLALSGTAHEVLLGAIPQSGVLWGGEGALMRVFVSPVVLSGPSPKRLTSLCWSSTGSYLACGTADGFVQSWNLSLLRRTLRLLKIDWSSETPPLEPPFIPITIF